MQVTNITLSPTQTADTSVHVLKIVANTTEIDFYFDNTKVGCTNSGGTGGCTAWTVGVSPSAMSTGWGVKTNAAATASIKVYGWQLEQ